MQHPKAPDDNTPLLAPQDVSDDTRYLVAWIDRKIDGVYQRIQDVTASLADRVNSIEVSLATCQSASRERDTASAAANTAELRRRDRLEKYFVPIIVATVTSLGAFIFGRLTR